MMNTPSNSLRKAVFMTFFALFLGAVAIKLAYALNSVSTSSFAYDLYNFTTSKVLNGPVGWLVAMGAIIFGAITAMRGHLAGLMPIVAGLGIIKAHNLAKAMGMLIR